MNVLLDECLIRYESLIRYEFLFGRFDPFSLIDLSGVGVATLTVGASFAIGVVNIVSIPILRS